MTTPYADRLAELDRRIAEGTIARGSWDVCLLSALSPEALEAEDAAVCPSDVMPPWLAYLTPGIDDCTSEDYWPDMLREYQRAAHVWQSIDTDGWGLCRRRHLVRCIDIALGSVTRDQWGVRNACEEVRRLLVDGGTEEEWIAARASARVAARASAGANTAARAAAWTAWTAAGAAGAADAAADAAALTAGGTAAETAVWDRLTRFLLADITTLGEGGDLGDRPAPN